MLFGPDTSHYEPNVDWSRVKTASQFAFTKATEGITLVDPLFARYWAEMKAVGLVRGAYHFFHPNINPVEQAKYFLRAVGELVSGDLPAVLDFETLVPGYTSKEYCATALAWLNEVEAATKKVPIVYGSPGILEVLNSAEFARYPLWIAEYGVRAPRPTSPWKNWTFWQFSESYPVAGVPNKCDANYFNGGVEQLNAIATATTTKE